MNSNNYVVIQGWMCNELGLKGNELLIFALIHGFSQDGVSQFQGGRKYIADTFNITLPTVDKSLKKLLDLNYIIKTPSTDYIHTDIYTINWGVVKKLYEGGKEILRGGSKEILPSNISNKKNNKTISKDIVFTLGAKKSKSSKKPTLWDSCVSLIDNFTDDKTLRTNLVKALNLFIENSRDAGTPFYTNNFKGKLNTLSKLTSNIYEQDKIVVQTLDNGWNNFYALKTQRDGRKVRNAVTDIEQMKQMPEVSRTEKERFREEIRNGNGTQF